MDIGTHLGTGLVLSTFFDSPMAKAVCILGSIVPDMSLIPIYIHRYGIHKEFKIWKYLGAEGHAAPPSNLMGVYYLFHSFLVIGALFFSAWYWGNDLIWALAWAWGLHLLWDIPTHVREWANRPLYPVSSLRIEGIGNWWKQQMFSSNIFVAWVVLLTLYFFLS